MRDFSQELGNDVRYDLLENLFEKFNFLNCNFLGVTKIIFKAIKISIILLKKLFLALILAGVFVAGSVTTASFVYAVQEKTLESQCRPLVERGDSSVPGLLCAAVFEIFDDLEVVDARLDIIENSLMALPEVCDDADNNLNDQIDETFSDKGDTCDNGELGICFDEGQMICSADGTGTECSVGPGTPETELCGDGLDNDCDGTVDETAPDGSGILRDPCVAPFAQPFKCRDLDTNTTYGSCSEVIENSPECQIHEFFCEVS